MWAIRHDASFWLHLPVTAAVIAVAIVVRISLLEAAALALATGLVWVAELINTAVECLVRCVHPKPDPRVGLALDIAAGGVLVAAITAVVVGAAILGPPVAQWGLSP